jgi:hypothetical protein
MQLETVLCHVQLVGILMRFLYKERCLMGNNASGLCAEEGFEFLSWYDQYWDYLDYFHFVMFIAWWSLSCWLAFENYLMKRGSGWICLSTALLDIYAERGSTEAAGRILDEYKSSVTWNAMISVYAKSRSPELCYVAAFG